MNKFVDGVVVKCSAQEEAEILAEWAANDPKDKTPSPIEIPAWGKAVIAELAGKSDASAEIKALDANSLGVAQLRAEL